jgi:phosphotransferase system enzyme I (PtsI)
LTTVKPEKVFQGNGVSPGMVLGQALKLDSHNRVILRISVTDVEEEVRRLEHAVAASKEQLEVLKQCLEEKVGREHSFMLDVHILMLEDNSLMREILTLIRKRHVNAEWAVRQATDRLLQAYEALKDEFFRERRGDIENVAERILENLSGDRPFSWEPLPENLIVISHDFNASSFATMDFHKVRGLALESGGRTSHTAIIARSLQLPAVMQIRDFLSQFSSGDKVLLNGDEGQVILNPTAERLEALHLSKEGTRSILLPDYASAVQSSVTLDGTPISLRANIELPYEVESAKSYGAEGIGLFRSEFLFFAHPGAFPGMQEQFETYRLLVQAMSPYPVAIRTLDAGSDKVFGGMEPSSETNPSMGLRGIRLSLSDRKAFGAQIEAILRASCLGKIEIVLPMISSVEEIWEAKSIIAAMRSEIAQSVPGSIASVAIGAMIEVPSAVFALEVLAEEVDLFCVGTNDLIQYMLAVDRGNAKVAHLFQPLHPSILHSLSRIAGVCERLHKPVRICGEISSNPYFAVLLLGMGFRQLSMTPLSIPLIREVIRSVSIEDCKGIAKRTLEFVTARQVGEYLIKSLSRLVDVDIAKYAKEVLPMPTDPGAATG